MFGISSCSSASRVHGSSLRKRSATSYVAPPHASADHSPGSIRAMWGATLMRSRVRTRVASSDWCASRNVVSVTATPLALAQRLREALRAEPYELVA